MNKKILVTLVGVALSPSAFSATVDTKLMAPNQYDCTVDELELYVMKRTESLRKESSLTTWEDFKTTQAKASSSVAQSASNSGANGNATAEAIAMADASANLKKTGTTDGKEKDEEECNLFFSDMEDINMDDMEISMPEGGFSGGLDMLTDFAKEQATQLWGSLSKVLTDGFCERLSTDYLTELGTDYLDDQLKEEYGYTTDDIAGGNFANEVVNDNLKEDRGTSDAQLLNIMDEDLNKKRESYMKKQLDNKLDDVEDEILE